jgi:hypothetical protein
MSGVRLGGSKWRERTAVLEGRWEAPAGRPCLPCCAPSESVRLGVNLVVATGLRAGGWTPPSSGVHSPIRDDHGSFVFPGDAVAIPRCTRGPWWLIGSNPTTWHWLAGGAEVSTMLKSLRVGPLVLALLLARYAASQHSNATVKLCMIQCGNNIVQVGAQQPTLRTPGPRAFLTWK